MSLVLASKSSSRVAMLSAAGVIFEKLPVFVDESAILAGLLAQNISPRDCTDMLAEAKALRGSMKRREALVMGCDSIVAFEDSAGRRLLEKPASVDDAKAHLALLSGRSHDIWSGVVIAEQGRPVWRHVERARMTMRALSAEFIDDYVAQNWDDIRHCVGCYQLEAEGAQLFTKIEGSHFTVLGMPLLAVLDYLRVRGEMAS